MYLLTPNLIPPTALMLRYDFQLKSSRAYAPQTKIEQF